LTNVISKSQIEIIYYNYVCVYIYILGCLLFIYERFFFLQNLRSAAWKYFFMGVKIRSTKFELYIRWSTGRVLISKIRKNVKMPNFLDSIVQVLVFSKKLQETFF
jgi:hypothetical protein